MRAITKIVLNPSLTDTPAHVNMRTGVMEVSEGFRTLPKAFQVFILCHEYAHRMADTRDEKAADEIAFRFYANLGYPLSESVLALTQQLNKDSSYHISRAEAVYKLAKNFDKQVYGSHAQFNLQSQQVRKFVMRRHKNKNLRELSSAIRSKNYEVAKQLIAAELPTLPPGSPQEKAYKHLRHAVEKVASCMPPVGGQGQHSNRKHQERYPSPKPRTHLEMGFSGEEDFSNFADELAGFADEMEDIARFNDEFDAFADEIEASFSGESEELAAFLAQDHADVVGFADDLEAFTDDYTGQANPYEYASLKGEKKKKRQERKDNTEKRKQQRLDNKTKIADAQAQAKVTRANAAQTRADKGTGFKFDKETLNGVLNTAGGVLNAATGGGGGILGKILNPEGANVQAPGSENPPMVETDKDKGAEAKTGSTGVPIWVWIVGAVVVVTGIGAAIYFFTRPKPKAAKATK